MTTHPIGQEPAELTSVEVAAPSPPAEASQPEAEPSTQQPQAGAGLVEASPTPGHAATVDNLGGLSALVMLQSPRSRAAEVVREIHTQLLTGAWRRVPDEPTGSAEAWEESVPAALGAALRLDGPKTSRAVARVGEQSMLPMVHEQAARRALAIVSRRRGEGRSFLAANLAISLAQSGARVALIDADLHQPCLHRMFGVAEQARGIVQMLQQGMPSPLVAPLSALPNLQLLPAGGVFDVPSELLQRERFVSVVHELARKFDHVLIDTPAAERGADWQIVAGAAGLVALVVRTGVSRVDELQSTVRQLHLLRVQMAGVIVNG